jgi:hypothetical protein
MKAGAMSFAKFLGVRYDMGAEWGKAIPSCTKWSTQFVMK